MADSERLTLAGSGAAHADEPLRAGALAAYDRGDADAIARLAEALEQFPGDGGLLIADARARSAAGDPQALARLFEMVRRAPDWLDGQSALAQLLWEAGQHDTYLAEFELALQRGPGNLRLWLRYLNAIAGSGDHAKAADAARRLRAIGADSPAIRLVEAHHAGMAGQLQRAGRLLEAIDETVPDKALESARHRLRCGDPEAAANLLDTLRAGARMDTAGWALLELAWRACGDQRHLWLADPDKHVASFDLGLDPGELGRLARLLRSLHHAGGQPLGQSVRGGTQTRGNLWLRVEPEIVSLRARLLEAVGAYVAGLAPVEAAHPLRPCFDKRIDLATGWSIRLLGGGHHASHIHSHGVISSACHIALPPGAGQDGWLELGRPPADIALALEPVAMIEPRPGRLVLFPSYLYHATRPFAAGERLSVAFDAAPAAPTAAG